MAVIALLAPLAIAGLGRLAARPPRERQAIAARSETPAIDIPRVRALSTMVRLRHGPARNLFSFAERQSRAGSVRPTHVGAPAEPAALPPAAATPIQLIGMAQETDGSRIAIIVGAGTLVLAIVGDRVMQRYRVLAIQDDSVELADEFTSGLVSLGYGAGNMQIAAAAGNLNVGPAAFKRD